MFSVIQRQHKEWVDNYFPEQRPEIPAAGMVEEAGELLHAILAKKRGMLWGHDPRYPANKIDDDVYDSIGDCVIYFISFCNASGWEADTFDAPRVNGLGRNTLDMAVDLVKVAAIFYSTHDHSMATRFIGTIKALCEFMGVDFYRAVLDTWYVVRERKRT